MKTHEELERLAEASSELDLEVEEDRREYWRMIGELTKADLNRLRAIHRRRALDAMLDR